MEVLGVAMTLENTSQLSRMIARLTTQRSHLDMAASHIRDLPGPILEIGLGKGRTYDHLRHLFPDRDIYAFDRSVHAPLRLRPDTEHLFVGEFKDTLPNAAKQLPPAALVHADFGSEDKQHDSAQALWLGPLIRDLVAIGGVVISDRELSVSNWVPVDGPASDWPYFQWRVCQA